MNVIESLIGRVENVDEGIAFVTLHDIKRNTFYESRCDLNYLFERGINKGDEFSCEVVKENDKCDLIIKKLEPKPISKEDMKEIHNSFIGRWEF